MFFITCFSNLGVDKSGYPDLGAYRTMGYYGSYEMAAEDLNSNNCNMHEYVYRYAVIEEIPEGIYPTCNDRIFFEFDNEKNGYFEIDTPSIFENVNIIAF